MIGVFIGMLEKSLKNNIMNIFEKLKQKGYILFFNQGYRWASEFVIVLPDRHNFF